MRLCRCRYATVSGIGADRRWTRPYAGPARYRCKLKDWGLWVPRASSRARRHRSDNDAYRGYGDAPLWRGGKGEEGVSVVEVGGVMVDDSLGGVSEIIRFSPSDGSALVSESTMTLGATGMRRVTPKASCSFVSS